MHLFFFGRGKGWREDTVKRVEKCVLKESREESKYEGVKKRAEEGDCLFYSQMEKILGRDDKKMKR